MKALESLIIVAKLCLCFLLLLKTFSTKAQICGTVLKQPEEYLLERPTKLAAQNRHNQKIRIPLNFYLVSPENTHEQEEDLLFLINVDELPKGIFFLTVAYERFRKVETFKFSNY